MATGIVHAKGAYPKLNSKDDVPYNLQCQSCSVMKSEFQALVNEIKSMTEIISILKEDLHHQTTTSHERKLNSTCTTKNPTRTSTDCCKCLDLETQLKDTLRELGSVKLISEILNKENQALKQTSHNDASTNNTWINARSRGPRGTAFDQLPKIAPTAHDIPVTSQYQLPTANRYDVLSSRLNCGNTATQHRLQNLNKQLNQCRDIPTSTPKDFEGKKHQQ